MTRIIDPVISSTKYPVSEKGCQLNIPDCEYLNSDGNCSAEWCIYSQLPKMITKSKILTCSVCKKNKTTVSTYSGITSYICPECQVKLIKVIEDKKCPICGTNININESICSSCSTKIRNRLDESN